MKFTIVIISKSIKMDRNRKVMFTTDETEIKYVLVSGTLVAILICANTNDPFKIKNERS